jgi:hypothetical protein
LGLDLVRVPVLDIRCGFRAAAERGDRIRSVTRDAAIAPGSP